MKSNPFTLVPLFTVLCLFTGCVHNYRELPAMPQYPENTNKYDLSGPIEVKPWKDPQFTADVKKQFEIEAYTNLLFGTHYKAVQPRNVKIFTVLHLAIETYQRPEGMWLDAHLIVSVRKPGIMWGNQMRYAAPRYFQAFAQHRASVEGILPSDRRAVSLQALKNLFTIDEFRKALEPDLSCQTPPELSAKTPAGYWQLSQKYQSGPEKNEIEAVRWAFLAYRQGHSAAGRYLAENVLSANIFGDNKRLLPLVKDMAQKGYPLAEYKLAVMFDNGDGTDENKKQALYWYIRAADHGLATAQYRVGKFYEDGWDNLEPDQAKAIQYYRLAARQGHKAAGERLEFLVEK